MTMLCSIKKAYGPQSAEATGDLLDRLNLSIPAEGEYTHSWDGGYLVFLNPAACVLRLTHQSNISTVSHPHIQRPLAMRDIYELRMDINPGMICPIDPRDAKALYQRFKDDHVLLWDQKIHNHGYRPDIHDPDKKIPVLIDHASVHDLSQSVSVIKRMIQAKTWLVNEYLASGWPEKEPPPVATAEDSYEDLRISFEQSWEAGTSEAMNHFWQAAVNARKSGLLVAGWLTTGMLESGYKNAFHGSQLYEQKWKGPR